MKLVYICSPLRGDIERNINRANSYCRFVVTQGAVPLAPHTIFTQFLDDEVLADRELGLQMGLELLKHCGELYVFGDRISDGMLSEMEYAKRLGIPIQYYSDQCERRDGQDEWRFSCI
ncbi:DUF4406 domain-containing protein [Desulfosporosinus sp. SB140]|uniref:DUF7768 domain-containing protein n=1 Tax=Desulfosporosinus paludis TaxID=3115649 RepID=UPI00389024AB